MTMARTAVLIGTALVLAGGVLKPANAAGEAAAATSASPCDLLTRDEVAAITTDEVLSTEVIGPDCHYRSNPDDSEVVLSVYPTGGAKQMQAIHDAGLLLNGIGAAVSGQGDVGKDVAGSIATPTDAAPQIGDEAAWEPNGVLAVRKGDAFIEITPPIIHDMDTHHGLSMPGDAEKKKISQAIAEKALARLVP